MERVDGCEAFCWRYRLKNIRISLEVPETIDGAGPRLPVVGFIRFCANLIAPAAGSPADPPFPTQSRASSAPAYAGCDRSDTHDLTRPSETLEFGSPVL
jgi:hypothetical protein